MEGNKTPAKIKGEDMHLDQDKERIALWKQQKHITFQSKPYTLNIQPTLF